MKTEPHKEHQWLHKLVGEWTYEADATMEPGKPPEKFKGTESVRSLGGQRDDGVANLTCAAIVD